MTPSNLIAARKRCQVELGRQERGSVCARRDCGCPSSPAEATVPGEIVAMSELCELPSLAGSFTSPGYVDPSIGEGAGG